ncbi:MAG: prolyl oligopeptidase family serine peptidase [Bacteroidetes bacterium]|nr:prolyl oligopeptidase family serine peptidase [Bacteroidota bacterium]
MRIPGLITVCIFFAGALAAQSVYKRPSDDVARIVEARPTPNVSISPTQGALLLTDYNPNPGIAVLAEPYLKLAGLRINPTLNARQRITEFVGLTVIWINEQRKVSLEIPTNGRLNASAWSPDGKKVAFLIDGSDGVQLWVADALSGKSKRIGNFVVNDVLGSPMRWLEDSERILVRAIPAGRGAAPLVSNVPSGPSVEEANGKTSQVMTFQDLLRNENDAKLFEYYAQSQLAIVNINTNVVQNMGTPGLYMSAGFSPDENYLLVTALQRPFSYRVQYSNFSRKTEIWDKSGKSIRTIVTFPVTDEIPRQGVVNGPREMEWEPLYPARLLWVEALDGGDPVKKADYRDKLMVQDAPFSAEPKEIVKLKFRFAGFEWLNAAGTAILSEYDRDRRWVTSYKVSLDNPAAKDTLFDVSVNDDYNAPGEPVYERLANGDYVMVQDSNWIFYSTEGASPKGQFPRLDRFNLKTKERYPVYTCPPNAYDEFITFVGSDRSRFITRYQTKNAPPNYILRYVQSGVQRALTEFKDPAPLLTGIEKQLIKYKRKDGVPLTGTLYLPLNYQKGQRVPLFIWAYPLEYGDAGTAGQVRDSDQKFTYFRGDSPLFFLTQGYAVLMDATMPVVGNPETMNNTFIEQIVSSGRAAIDYLDSLGIINRNMVGVGGHSYGAFMTANLLAHSDDYAFGIARSGAYNRSLTPFGFQSERRSYWEAQEIYQKLSPFNFANQIKTPLLLIHGEADNNPGTFTIQSERLFQAIKGNGGTARLVLLPFESHGYRARESILDVLAEMFEWAKKHGTRESTAPVKKQ